LISLFWLPAKRCRYLLASSLICANSFLLLLQAPKQQQQRSDPNAMSSAPASRARKGDFVDSRIGAGVNNNENMPANQATPAPAQTANKGFGDTGAPAIKVHQAPGGKSSGNILGWGN